jgi:hypothetical protein
VRATEQDTLMIGDVLFPPADQRRTAVSLLQWWESRRLLYNVAVGTTGVFTLVVVRLIAWTPPGLPMCVSWQPVVAYGLLANVFYTSGWAIELLAQRVWREKSPTLGPPLFRQGLAFSVGLTLLPIAMASIGWLARVWELLSR